MSSAAPIVHALGWLALAMSLLGVVYLLLAALATVLVLRRRPRRSEANAPAVTILKPLHGAPAGLRQTLEGYCAQEYAGPLQIVFGVHDADDPAIAIVRALQRAHPDIDIDLVIDSTIHGANRKATNLVNIAARAKHEVLILSDADIVVDRAYASRVASALAQPGVGLVSCFYVGQDQGPVWSRLSAMAINYRFLPSAVLGKAARLAEPCFGATIAVRAETLRQVGGFAAFVDHLADDYEMGRAVRSLGLRIAIPPMTVAHLCDERTAGDLVRRDLRWGRTVRQIDPGGYAGSIITHPLGLALIAAALLGPSWLTLGTIAGVITERIAF
ncbi:MAG TPA: bacteriohopanetetrol glucosamine biosynthesis glycosyltransferase HpnI, partial [Caulobacteraceae bacterium]